MHISLSEGPFTSAKHVFVLHIFKKAVCECSYEDHVHHNHLLGIFLPVE